METVTLEDVRDAASRISSCAHRTPVMTCRSLDRLGKARLYFKCEHLQKVGAFKFRGACNAISQLDESARTRGVVTHSSGNHAQAVALAARLLGITARIVMPVTAPETKRHAVIEYGGLVTGCEPTLEAREATANRIIQETGAGLVHPYNDTRVIAGQGTSALELVEEIPDLDVIFAPVGGGGLISGTCVVARSQSPPIRVFGAEPQGADDAFRSKMAGELIPLTSPRTIADGLLTSLGSLTWPYVRDDVERILTVSDQEIVEALRLFWQRTKQLIEPSAAVAVAAAIRFAQDQPETGLKIGVILSGGNADPEKVLASAKD